MSCNGCNGATVILLQDVSGGNHRILRCPQCNLAKLEEKHIIWRGACIDRAIQEFYSVADKGWCEQNPMSEV